MNKKILVLGGARFHGLQIAQALSQKNRVYALNRGNYKKDYKNIKQLIVDRNNKKEISSIFKESLFDIIIDNNAYLPNQVELILDIIKDDPIHYIFTSSIAVYLKHTSDHKLLEKEAKGIQQGIYDPLVKKYALEKFNSEVLIKKSKTNFTILRLPNIFGEGDFLCKLSYFKDRLEKKSLLLEKEIQKFSLIYVKDLVNIYQKLINNEDCFRRTLNISSPEILDYEGFFNRIYPDIYSKDKLFLKDAPSIWNQGYSSLFPWGPAIDISSLENILGKINFTPLENWCEKTKKWESINLKNKKPRWPSEESELKIIKNN